MGKEFIFYYDIICPYAYLASKLVGDVAKRTGAKLLWRPVLLGGIYKAAVPEERRDENNKVITKIPPQKRAILRNELSLLYKQHNLTVHPFDVVPDISTLKAMRLIASTHDDDDDEKREHLTHDLFDSLWKDKKDVSDLSVLQQIAIKHGFHGDIRDIVENKSSPARSKLIENTKEIIDRGGFGVPSFWANDKLFFGVDRMFFLEKELGNEGAHPFRLLNSPKNGVKKAKLTYYFDFASPWAYVGFKQLPRLIESVTPVKVDLELVPMLLGVLFREIGTPDVPMRFAGPSKLRYMQDDMNQWLSYTGLKDKFHFSSHFPIRSILPLRVAIAHPTYELVETIFDATWADDKNTGDEGVLRSVLKKAGYDDDELIQKTKSQQVKDILRTNTQRSVDTGLCGVPSYQVNDGTVIWGQDHQNIVADFLMGWEANETPLASKL